jgi:hypothetical protein
MDDNPRYPRKDAPPGRLDLRNFRLESAHALVLHLILGLSAGLRRYFEWIKEELRPDERGLLFPADTNPSWNFWNPSRFGRLANVTRGAWDLQPQLPSGILPEQTAVPDVAPDHLHVRCPVAS